MTSEKLYDFVIFGATGYTGRYCIEYMVRCLQKDGQKRSWAVAGRNVNKVTDARNEVAKLLDMDLSHIPIIEADVNDDESLLKMCSSCKVVLNVVGPYKLYGEPVVKACIKAKTHHVDISGEPQYLEKIQLELHKEAQEAGVYIVGSCGFDSIPCDVGLNFLREKFKPNELNSVAEYVSFRHGSSGNVVNHGTWDSMVHAFGSWHEVKPLREKLFSQFYKKPWPNFKYPVDQWWLPCKDPTGSKWCIPFWDVDRATVKRTQAYNYEYFSETPVQFESYMTVPSIFMILGLGMFGAFFAIFSFLEITRNLLLNYPSVFTFGIVSKDGPSRQQVLETSFQVSLVGSGWDQSKAAEKAEPPNRTITALIKGPNPAYVATAICLIQAAFTLLEDADKMTEKGGVVTPGVAFRNTSIVERLNRHGVTFEIVSET